MDHGERGRRGGAHRTRATLAGMLTVALGSCTPGAGPEPQLGPISAVQDASTIVLPLDSYEYAFDDLDVHRAAWLLTGRCVARFGGEYTITEESLEASLAPLDNINEGRYGLLDPQLAASHGYNVPNLGPDAADGADIGWDPSETEFLLVRGRPEGLATTSAVPRPTVPLDIEGNPLPEGGCSGEADRLLDEGAPLPPTNTELLNKLTGESYQRSESDSRVRDAMSEWSDCMRRSGFEYRSIWEPNDADWPEPAGDEEIATAVADVACKLEVNLVGIWLAVEAAYQNQLIEQHAEELAALRAYQDAVKGNAARILADEGTTGP